MVRYIILRLVLIFKMRFLIKAERGIRESNHVELCIDISLSNVPSSGDLHG